MELSSGSEEMTEPFGIAGRLFFRLYLRATRFDIIGDCVKRSFGFSFPLYAPEFGIVSDTLFYHAIL